MNLQATRISISVLLVALITLLGSQSVVAQPSPWINRTIVTQYVKNLLDTYNSLVNLNYGYYPDSHVLDRFRLYHAVGYSFNVTVMRLNSTTKAFVAFVFVPIMSASPLIIIDNNDTFIHFQFPNLPKSMEPTMSSLLKPNNPLGIIQVQGTSGSPNGTRLAPRAWIANATTMFANPMTSSADAANYLFQEDQRGFNTQTSTQVATSQTQTPTAVSREQTTHAQPSSDVFSWFNDNPLVKTIVTIFGSIITFLLFVIGIVILVWRKKVTSELKKLLHMD